MMENEKHKIAGLILAGGEGRRVGGKDKGLLPFRGYPLIYQTIQKFKSQLDWLAISANRNLEQYQDFKLPIFQDVDPWKHLGPLAGIASVSQFIPQNMDMMFVVPCDTPLLPYDLLDHLKLAMLRNSECQIAYAATENSIHPSIFLCKTEINSELPEHLASGKQSLKSWIFRHKNIKVYFPDEMNFTNMNYLETLAGYQ